MNKQFQFKDVKLKTLVSDICNEHWEITKPIDSNMAYLWYMYSAGVKQGDFKPFIFLSELNLLIKTNYITEDEKQNILSMLLSKDDDNVYVAGYALLTLRKTRISELGLWIYGNKKYENIDYCKDVINTESFIKLN